ncbi:MAG: PBECR4 domain-containing protein [Coprobacillus sp.]|nr:PBECR4 domain-containing protein [Coprobacillus sp.]
MSQKSNYASFKEYIKQTLFSVAPLYHSYFAERKYLIISPTFKNRTFYIISSSDNNFLHLTGLDTTLNRYDFYKKCENKTLNDNDFAISYTTKYGTKVGKSTIEAKLSVLPDIIGIFNQNVLIEEDFEKGNHVYCKVAFGKTYMTLGFDGDDYFSPKTLLKGQYIDSSKANKPILILSGPRKVEDKFDTIIVGDINIVKRYKDEIGHLLADSLKEELKEE